MKTVLIIDDEPDYRELLGEILEQNGWHVLNAGEGEKGLALAKAHRPEVVICDLLMPRCNGFQFCRWLRSDPSLSQTRIVITSGRDFDSDRNEAFAAGADEYLTKPIDPGKLVVLLSQMLTAEADQVSPSQVLTVPSAPTRVRFWGVRGSVPTPGPATVYYGGNTTCVEVRTGGQIIILDAGTGLRLLGRQLAAEFNGQPLELTLLLTHTHWDHIQGLPFFQPAYAPHNHLRIYGYKGARQDLDNALSSQMQTQFFPVAFQELPANLSIEEQKEMEFNLGAIQVQACFANHPGICVGYRLFTPEGSLAFFPDNEPHRGHRLAAQGPGAADPATQQFARSQDQKIVEFLRGVDMLIMDSQYDCEEYKQHVGWGHGCVNDVVELALQAEAKRLFLFHHDPEHDDAKISDMLALARQIVADRKSPLQVEAAREGVTLELGGS